MRFAGLVAALPMPVLTPLVAAVFTFGVVSPPEHCPAVTEPELRSAATSAVDWLVDNQRDDGSFLYEYDADTATDLGGYNAVRHAGVVMSLYMAAGYGVDRAADAADRGLVWSENRLTHGDRWVAAGSGRDDPSVGASALLLAGLAERRDTTGDRRHDELMGGLAQFLVGQIEPDGATTDAYDLATGQPTPGVRSKYATGEAYWALVQMARQFPDGPWGAAGERVGAYIASGRDAAEGMRHTRDHWAAYGLSETAASGDVTHDRALSADEVGYVRHQAEILGVIERWMSQQAGPWGVAVRGPALQRGGAYGTIGEALTRLWRVASAEPALADVRDPIAWRARCNASLTIEHQVRGTGATTQTSGAWFYGGVTRMDDQQHALSSLLQTIDIVRAGPPDSQAGWGGHRPSSAVWIVALVAALNPVRLARVVGRRRPRRPVVLAVAALVAAAVLSGPLLHWLDVSRPGFRVSAGLLGVIAGAIALARGISERPGVFVAIVTAPVVALAVGAAADRGVRTVVVAIAIAAALTGASFVSRPASAVERALDGLLVVVAVLVTVAGVMAV